MFADSKAQGSVGNSGPRLPAWTSPLCPSLWSQWLQDEEGVGQVHELKTTGHFLEAFNGVRAHGLLHNNGERQMPLKNRTDVIYFLATLRMCVCVCVLGQEWGATSRLSFNLF